MFPVNHRAKKQFTNDPSSLSYLRSVSGPAQRNVHGPASSRSVSLQQNDLTSLLAKLGIQKCSNIDPDEAWRKFGSKRSDTGANSCHLPPREQPPSSSFVASTPSTITRIVQPALANSQPPLNRPAALLPRSDLITQTSDCVSPRTVFQPHRFAHAQLIQPWPSSAQSIHYPVVQPINVVEARRHALSPTNPTHFPVLKRHNTSLLDDNRRYYRQTIPSSGVSCRSFASTSNSELSFASLKLKPGMLVPRSFFSAYGSDTSRSSISSHYSRRMPFGVPLGDPKLETKETHSPASAYFPLKGTSRERSQTAASGHSSTSQPRQPTFLAPATAQSVNNSRTISAPIAAHQPHYGNRHMQKHPAVLEMQTPQPKPPNIGLGTGDISRVPTLTTKQLAFAFLSQGEDPRRAQINSHLSSESLSGTEKFSSRVAKLKARDTSAVPLSHRPPSSSSASRLSLVRHSRSDGALDATAASKRAYNQQYVQAQVKSNSVEKRPRSNSPSKVIRPQRQGSREQQQQRVTRTSQPTVDLKSKAAPLLRTSATERSRLVQPVPTVTKSEGAKLRKVLSIGTSRSKTEAKQSTMSSKPPTTTTQASKKTEDVKTKFLIRSKTGTTKIPGLNIFLGKDPKPKPSPSAGTVDRQLQVQKFDVTSGQSSKVPLRARPTHATTAAVASTGVKPVGMIKPSQGEGRRTNSAGEIREPISRSSQDRRIQQQQRQQPRQETSQMVSKIPGRASRPIPRKEEEEDKEEEEERRSGIGVATRRYIDRAGPPTRVAKPVLSSHLTNRSSESLHASKPKENSRTVSVGNVVRGGEEKDQEANRPDDEAGQLWKSLEKQLGISLDVPCRIPRPKPKTTNNNNIKDRDYNRIAKTSLAASSSSSFSSSSSSLPSTISARKSSMIASNRKGSTDSKVITVMKKRQNACESNAEISMSETDTLLNDDQRQSVSSISTNSSISESRKKHRLPSASYYSSSCSSSAAASLNETVPSRIPKFNGGKGFNQRKPISNYSSSRIPNNRSISQVLQEPEQLKERKKNKKKTMMMTNQVASRSNDSLSSSCSTNRRILHNMTLSLFSVSSNDEFSQESGTSDSETVYSNPSVSSSSVSLSIVKSYLSDTEDTNSDSSTELPYRQVVEPKRKRNRIPPSSFSNHQRNKKLPSSSSSTNPTTGLVDSIHHLLRTQSVRESAETLDFSDSSMWDKNDYIDGRNPIFFPT